MILYDPSLSDRFLEIWGDFGTKVIFMEKAPFSHGSLVGAFSL